MKLLVVVEGRQVAPRFDLALEALIVGRFGGSPVDERDILLPGPSADELCGLILKEGVGCVICGGIEEAHYQYLRWKKIEVLDRVIGAVKDVLPLALAGDLRAGAVVRGREG